MTDMAEKLLFCRKKLGVEANGKNLNDLKLQKNNEAKVAQEHLDAAKKTGRGNSKQEKSYLP